MPEGGIQFDAEGRVVLINKSAREMTGYQLEDFRAPIWFDDPLVHATQTQRSVDIGAEPYRAAFRGEHFSGGPVYIRHKEGNLFPVSVCAIPLGGREDKSEGVLEVFTRNRVSLGRRQVEEVDDASPYLGPTMGTARLNLMRRFKHEILTSGRLGQTCGLLRVRLKDFAGSGATLGQEGREKALGAIEETLLATLRVSDHILAWKSSRFAVLLMVKDEDSLSLVQGRISSLLDLVSFSWWGLRHSGECEVDQLVLRAGVRPEEIEGWMDE